METKQKTNWLEDNLVSMMPCYNEEKILQMFINLHRKLFFIYFLCNIKEEHFLAYNNDTLMKKVDDVQSQVDECFERTWKTKEGQADFCGYYQSLT